MVALGMVGLSTLGIVLSGLVGQQGGAQARIVAVAVQSVNEGRSEKHYGPGLEDVRAALAPLDFDSFSLLKRVETSCPLGDERSADLNAKYRLHVEPVSREPDGRVRLKVRISMPSPADGSKRVNALDTTLTIAPGKHLNLGGLRLEKGELVVVLKLIS